MLWVQNQATSTFCLVWNVLHNPGVQSNTNSSPYSHSPSAPPFVWWYTLPQNPNYCYHNPGRGTAPACRRVRRREQRKAEDCDWTQTYNPFLYLQNEKHDELWSSCQLCVNLILSRPICHSLDPDISFFFLSLSLDFLVNPLSICIQLKPRKWDGEETKTQARLGGTPEVTLNQTQSEWAVCPVKDGYVWMNHPEELSLEQQISLLISWVFSLCISMMLF